jgi:glutaredoxin
MSPLKKLVLAALVAALGALLWAGRDGGRASRDLPPLYQEPYVVVYGQESCSYCQAMRRELAGRGVPYVYKEVGDRGADSELIERMRLAGRASSRFDLPVVDVNAHIMSRPDADEVQRLYAAVPAAAAASPRR